MKKVNIVIYTIISTILLSIATLAYIYSLRTLVETRVHSNIALNTKETANYIDNYVETNYTFIQDIVKNGNEDKDQLIIDVLNDYNSYGFSLAGYYNDETDEYFYKSLMSQKEGTFNFKYLHKQKTLEQKVSIIEERFLVDNDSRNSVALYRVDRDEDKFFFFQKLDIMNELIINPYKNNKKEETNAYYFLSTNDGVIVNSSFEQNEMLTMNKVFNNDISRDEFNLQFKEDNVIEMALNEHKVYYVAKYNVLSKYNETNLYLYGLVETIFVENINQIVFNATLVFSICFAIVVFIYGLCLLLLFLAAKKKYSKEGSLIKDDNHYSVLLDKRGRVVSYNNKFSSLGLRRRGELSSCLEILELEGNNENLSTLLESRGELTAKIKDFDGSEKFIKFLVIKRKFGYQLLGSTPDEVSFVPLGSEEDAKPISPVQTIVDSNGDTIDIVSLYRDDLYDVYNKKALFMKINKIIKEEAENNKNTYLFYFGNSNEEEVLRTYGNAIEELLNGSMISMVQKEIGEDIEIYNVDDHHFAFLYELPDTFQTLNKLMEKLERIAKKPAKILSNEIEISIDFGIYHFASFDLKKASPKKLISKADLSFKQAVNLPSKNFKLYDKNLEIAYELEDIIADDIRNGLDNNEFVTFFQPNYSLKEDKVTGFECLLRWNNEKYRYDSPFKYIKVAEKVGLINDIGYFTLVESFKLIKDLNDPSLHISVNVSPAQFLQPGFISRLVAMYSEFDVPYSSICIEITETFLIQSMNEVVEKLKYLRSFGIKIYLDDFGTGYSSLLYLAELPIDVIKIDKEFITPLKTSKSSRTIVSELIQIAYELEIELVAEGVEDDYQVNFLEKKKCDNIQGYYFSKPVPKELVVEALKIKRENKDKK